jgi:hypothetical protein
MLLMYTNTNISIPYKLYKTSLANLYNNSVADTIGNNDSIIALLNNTIKSF